MKIWLRLLEEQGAGAEAHPERGGVRTEQRRGAGQPTPELMRDEAAGETLRTALPSNRTRTQ
jgi:hypothetical protein